MTKKADNQNADDQKPADRGDSLTADDNVNADDQKRAQTSSGNKVVSDDDLDKAIKTLTGGEADDDKKKAADDKKSDDKKKPEAKKDDDGKKEDHLIPKARFDEALGKKDSEIQQLAARLAALEKSTKPKDEKDPMEALAEQLNTTEGEYEAALLDNDKEKAAQIRAELNKLRDAQLDMRIAAAAEQARTGSSDDVKYDNLLDQLEKDYTLLQPKHEDFDQAKVNEMVAMRNTYIEAGKTQSEALAIAAKYVLGPKPEPKKAADDKVDDSKDASLRDDRTIDASRKAADAVKKTPASMDGGGGPPPTSVIDVNKLTQEQFAKVPEDALAILRGDAVAS